MSLNEPIGTRVAVGGCVLVLSGDSKAWRRRLGPLAWAALEHMALAAHPEGVGWVVPVGVRDVAAGIGVTKDTAARAIATLGAAGLVALTRVEKPDGRQRSGYQLHLPEPIRLVDCPTRLDNPHGGTRCCPEGEYDGKACCPEGASTRYASAQTDCLPLQDSSFRPEVRSAAGAPVDGDRLEPAAGLVALDGVETLDRPDLSDHRHDPAERIQVRSCPSDRDSPLQRADSGRPPSPGNEVGCPADGDTTSAASQAAPDLSISGRPRRLRRERPVVPETESRAQPTLFDSPTLNTVKAEAMTATINRDIAHRVQDEARDH